jgi:predicted acyl esterase
MHTLEGGPDGLSYEKVIWHLPLMDMPRLLGRNPGFYYDWIRHPDFDDYWKSIDVSAKLENIGVPVHTFGGWFDMMSQGTLTGYAGMSRQGKNMDLRRNSEIWISARARTWTRMPSSCAGLTAG